MPIGVLSSYRRSKACFDFAKVQQLLKWNLTNIITECNYSAITLL